jgi:hypothetical protein
MVALSLDPGGRPKRDIIELAFEELGSAGYEFERTPEEVTAALRRLNLFMAEWPWSQLTYSLPMFGHGSAEESSGLADAEITAAAYELARRLAGMWGATFSPEQRKAAAEAKAQALPVSVPTAYMAANTVRGMGRGGRAPFITERVSGEE